MIRRSSILLGLAVLLPLLAAQHSPVSAQSFSNGERHPFYTAYVYRNGDWVRYETVQEEVERSISETVRGPQSLLPPPDSRPWRPAYHRRYWSRLEPVPYWDPNAGPQVVVGYDYVTRPRAPTFHRHSSHPCVDWRDLWFGPVQYTYCARHARQFHSHGTFEERVAVTAPAGAWRTRNEPRTSTDGCEGANECAGHSKPGWNYEGHSTEWELNYTETVERTVTYSCGSACTDVFVPIPPPVPDDMDPEVPQFDLSWRLDVSGPSPLLTQGAFADQEFVISDAQLLCDGIPCDDPSLYQDDDFEVRPRPGGLEGLLSLQASDGIRACDQPLQAGCDLFFVTPEVSGDLTSSGLLSVRMFSPPADGEQVSLLLSDVVAEVEIWEWDPQLTFVPDLTQPCTPTLDGCVQEGEWVPSGPPLPKKDRVEQVDATLRLFSTTGDLVSELQAGQPLPLRVVGTMGS